MTCPACESSSREPTHLFHASCPGCTARAVSRGLNFARFLKARRLDPEYQDELDLFEVTHAQVKAAHETDFSTRRNNATPERQA